MNWADLDFSTPIAPKAANYFESSSEYSDIEPNSSSKVYESKPLNPPQKAKPKGPGKKNRCYTCKPRGKVKKYVIRHCGKAVFHFDLHHRPLILITPDEHYTSFFDMPSDLIMEMVEAVKRYCEDNAIKDYQVSWSGGKWQSHKHVHLKLRLTEECVALLRNDHFKKVNPKQQQ